VDEAAGTVAPHGLEKHEDAIHVSLNKLAGVQQRAIDMRLGCEIDNGVEASNRIVNCFRIADVALHEGVAWSAFETSKVGRVPRVGELVEDTDAFVSPLDEKSGKRTADETGPSGHNDTAHRLIRHGVSILYLNSQAGMSLARLQPYDTDDTGCWRFVTGMLMPLEAVTFDFHNTLAHCDQWFQHEIRTLVPAVLAWQAQRSGNEISASVLETAVVSYRALRLSIIEHGEEMDATVCACHVLGEMGVPIDEAEINAAIDSIMLDCLETSQPVEGAVEAVRSLADAGVCLGVVSAAVYHPFLEWSLEKFGILDAFDVIVTSASAGYYKTRPELYLHTLQRLGAEAAASVHVGDSHRFDVEGARRAGMRTVWYSPSDEAGQDTLADLTVSDLSGLAPLLLDTFGTDR
jgi:HAD superfamily hydrolase (TIGR01509 family)